MKKRLLSLGLILTLCLGLAVPALAAEESASDMMVFARDEDEGMRLTPVGEYPLSAPASGDGWSYDGKHTLTLKGLTDEKMEIRVFLNYDEQFHIVLADGTESRLGVIHVEQNRFIPGVGDSFISADLTISGGGTLYCSWMDCGCLTMNGGNVCSSAISGSVTVQSLVMNAGVLEFPSLQFRQDTWYSEAENNGKNMQNCPPQFHGGTIVLDRREWANYRRESGFGFLSKESECSAMKIRPLNRTIDFTLFLQALNGTFTGEDGQPLTLDRRTDSSDYYLYTADGEIAEYAKFSKEAIKPVGGFADVKTGDWFAEPVLWAVEKGITAGTSAATFSPNQDCTAAQILTFLWRAGGSPKPAGSSPFPDVQSGDYYAQAAAWAYEKGMVSGDTFSPDTPCTRSMAVMYLWKAAGSPGAEAAGFADVPAEAEYAKAVAWAVEKGITQGTSATEFSPDTVCTRGHIVTFLYRAFAAQQ